MPSKEYTWYKIADHAAELQLGPNGMAETEAGGKQVCIVKAGDEWRACARKCPHAGGTMSEGYLDALGHIVCPLHRYKFDLRNGRNTSGEGYFLKTYPVEEREDGIYIGIARESLFF
jgi:3-phenylpropionate/trans-cinnamate dioxygenase ferredoxin subunit